MRAAAEPLAEIAHEAAHVGAGTAFDVQAQAIAIALAQLEAEHVDLARRRLDVFAAARAPIQRHPALLESPNRSAAPA